MADGMTEQLVGYLTDATSWWIADGLSDAFRRAEERELREDWRYALAVVEDEPLSWRDHA